MEAEVLKGKFWKRKNNTIIWRERQCM